MFPANPGRSESGIIRSSVNGANIMCFIMFDLIRFVLDMSIRMLHPTRTPTPPPPQVYLFIHLFIHSFTHSFFLFNRSTYSFIHFFISSSNYQFIFLVRLAHPFVCTTINRFQPILFFFGLVNCLYSTSPFNSDFGSLEHAAICRERGRCHNSFYSFITASRGEWGVSQLNWVFSPSQLARLDVCVQPFPPRITTSWYEGTTSWTCLANFPRRQPLRKCQSHSASVRHRYLFLCESL